MIKFLILQTETAVLTHGTVCRSSFHNEDNSSIWWQRLVRM